MSLLNTLRRMIRRAAGSPKAGGYTPGRGRPTRRLEIEPLEDRCVPASVTIGPGDSIQAAVDAAAPGTTIYLRSGTYLQSVVVNTPDIALVGIGRQKPVIADPAGAGDGADNGIRVNDAGDRFQARNLVLKDFDRNGIFAVRCDDFVFSKVDVVASGRYGLFPVRSDGGLIEDCTATGHTDSGIYVGTSTHITVRNCRAWANVVGIEVENSSDIDVVNNLAYDNTAGIGVFLLPGLSVTTSADVRLRGNVVVGNNRANFGDPGDLVSFVPSGIGIFVLGVDRAIIERNVVIGNNLIGIGVGSVTFIAQAAGLPPEALATIEPNSDGAVVRNNLVVFNGLGAPNPTAPSADLFWDGTGTDNHWRDNVFFKSVPRRLPS